jgi:hypothetical protein
MNAHDWKHQTRNTKLQKSTKLQTSNLPIAACWSLEFGTFLELGVWCLVFPFMVLKWFLLAKPPNAN